MSKHDRAPPETMPRPPPRPPIPDEDLFKPGTKFDHFKVLRLLGRGGMGEVYLARDTGLGRRVAIKVMRPETLGSREAVERFLHEARTTARFSHPHIVTIHHVGERQGSPYVALEYLEGRSLRDRMELERIEVTEAMRIGLDVAEALAEAHRHHVLHRDLKPENVMLPRDGRLRVVDFGLAKAMEPLPAEEVEPVEEKATPPAGFDAHLRQTQVEKAHGSPGYMAPEQWTQQTVTPAVDLWALGVVLFEMIHGHHPYAPITDVYQLCHAVSDDEPAPPVTATAPEALVRLIERCMDKDPVGRPSAEQAARELRALVSRRRSTEGIDVAPFRGLLPFRERHAAQFHGRDAELAAFLERVREQPVLPVVGPSGTGKSSFVQAGVIPRLREQGRWLVLRLRPGRDPLRALAARLMSTSSTDAASRSSFPTFDPERPPAPDDRAAREHEDRLDAEEQALAEDLRLSPKRLALRLAELAEREAPARVLLFVDQLEELFTLVDDEELRLRWLEAVCAAADDPDGPVRVVFTVRDDFLGRLTESPAALRALTHVTVLGVPGADALRSILTEPVADAGYEFDDPAVVDEMVAEVEHEAAALPLLQFTGELLWARRDRERRLLLRAELDALGGVGGALARHADGVLEGLSASQLRAARELLLRLVTEHGTRRVLPYRDLPRRHPELVAAVLERLIQGRLILVREGRHLGPGQTGLHHAEFELVHESLIQRWDRLARWIDESREERTYLADLGQAAELWHRRGRRPEELWEGDALHDALRTRQRLDVDLPDRVEAFLAAGQRRQELQDRGRRNATVALVVAAVVVALVTSALSLLAMREGRHARQQQHVAEVERAEAQREGARAALVRGDVLEARAKLRGSLETVDTPMTRALWWQLADEPLRWHRHLGATVYSLDVSPDGRWVAAGLQDGTVHLVDTVTSQAEPLRGLADPVQAVTFSPDGARLACGTYGGQIAIWELADRQSPILVEEAHGAYISVIAFAPDGRSFATASRDGTVRLWAPDSGAPLRTLEVSPGRVHHLAFSSTGAWLATGDRQGGVGLWDPGTGVRLRTLEGHERAVHRVAFAPDGSWLASASWDGTVRLWDLPSGTPRAVLRGHEGRINDLAIHPDGTRLVTAGNDGTVRVWSARDGEPLSVLRGHADRVSGVRVAPDGTQIASRSDDQTVRLWDLAGDAAPRELEGHTASIMVLQYEPEGALLYSGGVDHEVRAWSARVHRDQPPDRGHGAMVTGLAVTADGAVAASASLDQTVRLWEVASGRPLATLRGQQDGQLAVALAPAGDAVASAGVDGVVRVWDVASHETRWSLEGHRGPVHDLLWSADGRTLTTAGGDHTVRTWDLVTGEPLRVLRDHDRYLTSLALSPDGRQLFTGANDGWLASWDWVAGRMREEWSSPAGHVWGLRFGPDGRGIVFGGDDQTLRTWDAHTGQERLALPRGARIHVLDVDPEQGRIGIPCSDERAYVLAADGSDEVVLRGHRGTVNALRFARERVLTTGDDGTVRAWDIATGRPLWHAPCLLPDPVELRTQEGWFAADGTPLPEGDGAQWRAAVDRRARHATAAPGRPRLCLQDHDDALEIWDPAADRQLARVELAGLQTVAATADACLALDRDGVVRRVGDDGEAVELARGAVALAVDGDAVLVAADGEVRVLDAAGAVIDRGDADLGTTAVGRVDSRLAVGYREGAIEVADGAGGLLRMEEVPASPVVRLVPGPEGTLLAGFGDGSFGVWSLDTGRNLYRAKLHGALVHLLTDGEVIHAATELGDHLSLDLGAFHRDYCALLTDVWSEVPVVWASGRPEVAGPPADHPCAAP